jgi:hypothetical protein
VSLQALLDYLGIDTDMIEIVDAQETDDDGPEFDCS